MTGRKGILRVSLLCLILIFLCAAAAAESDGFVAKVTTPQGPLKIRVGADARSRVLAEIPNGTCLLVTEEGETWCRVLWQEQAGYCKTEFLTFLRDADPALLCYRVLRAGDMGDDVLSLKQRLQDLGYIRAGSTLTNVYNDVMVERIRLFQRQTGMTEDGIASQELQAYLFSDRAPVCSQTLPRVRTRVSPQGNENRVICGCCMGEGCECCGFTGWITY